VNTLVREYKASLYARAGVPEYWIVDLGREALEVHRAPEASPTSIDGWRYRAVDVLRAPATVAPLIGAGAVIPFVHLLP
jgi:Uma2 family endonuclease